MNSYQINKKKRNRDKNSIQYVRTFDQSRFHSFSTSFTKQAKPNTMLVGVGTKELGDLYSKVFAKKADVKRAMIVHSLEDGLDEISTTGNELKLNFDHLGKTHIWMIENGNIIEQDVEPENFGLPNYPIHSILGSSPAENSKIFHRLLANEKHEQLKPYLDFVLLQCSAALVVSGKAKDFIEGTKVALAAIESGKALELLQNYVKLSHHTNAN